VVKEQEKSEMEESKVEDNVEPAPQADQPASDGPKEETVEAAAEAEADMLGAAIAAEGEGKDVEIESDVAQGLGAANEE